MASQSPQPPPTDRRAHLLILPWDPGAGGSRQARSRSTTEPLGPPSVNAGQHYRVVPVDRLAWVPLTNRRIFPAKINGWND